MSPGGFDNAWLVGAVLPECQRLAHLPPGECPSLHAHYLLEAHLPQKLCCPKGTHSAAADQGEWAIMRKLGQAGGQLGLWKMDRPGHVSLFIFLWLAHI